MPTTEFPVLPKVAIRSNHPDAFQSGQWAMIDGVRWITPSNGNPGRACYHVRFVDDSHDYWPIDDPTAAYEFRSAKPRASA